MLVSRRSFIKGLIRCVPAIVAPRLIFDMGARREDLDTAREILFGGARGSGMADGHARLMEVLGKPVGGGRVISEPIEFGTEQFTCWKTYTIPDHDPMAGSVSVTVTKEARERWERDPVGEMIKLIDHKERQEIAAIESYFRNEVRNVQRSKPAAALTSRGWRFRA